MIQAVLTNIQHPEYGVVTVPFPIPREEYDHIPTQKSISRLSGRSCLIMPHPVFVIRRLRMTRR